jgi:hypothetical protein
MIKILIGTLLMARLACQRLDVDWELVLRLWRNRPVIQVIVEIPEEVPLIERIHAVLRS